MSFNNTDPFSRSYTNNVFPGKVDLTDPDVLLQLAQDHGGAVAEAANELMHPKTSILSTVSDGFKSAFSGFIDTIQKPSEVVAGILSDKYSVSDTIKNHIKVSDVLFGTPSKGDGFSAGAVKWAGRTAVDVLTDPITWLTFGATGVGKLATLGLSAVKEISVGENVAKELGGSFISRFNEVGSAEIALNRAGHTTLDYAQTLVTKNMIQAGSGLAQDMDIVNVITGKAEKILTREVTGAMTEISDGIWKARPIAETVVDGMLKATIDMELHPDYAALIVSKTLEKFPQLAETLMDKGGIKWAGIQILEGAKIGQLVKYIPAINVIDRLTMPVRSALRGMFDANPFVGASGFNVRAPLEFKELTQGWQDSRLALQDERLKDAEAIVKENKLTVEEDRQMQIQYDNGTAFTEPRLEGVRQVIMGIHGPGDLEFLRKSGVQISDTRQKMSKVVTKDYLDQKNAAGFRMGTSRLSTRVGVAQQQDVLKFINKETGKELDESGRLMVGHPETFGLTLKKTEDEINSIITQANSAVAVAEKNVGAAQDEIVKLSKAIQDHFSGNMNNEISKLLDGMSIKDAQNSRAMFDVIRSEVGMVDVDKLVQSRTKESWSAGVKTQQEFNAAIKDISPQTIVRLKEDIMSGAFSIKDDTDRLNEALKNYSQTDKIVDSTKKVNVEGELKDVYDKLKLGQASVSYTHIAQNIDKEATAKFLESAKNAYEQNPTGVRRLLDAIIGKKNIISDMLHDMDLEKITARQNLSELPNDARFYVNNTGIIHQAYEVSAQEARLAGFQFEDSASKVMLIRGLQAVNSGMTYQFMHSAVEAFSATKDLAGKDWRVLDMSGIKNAGNAIDARLGQEYSDRYFSPQIANAIEQFSLKAVTNPGTAPFLKAFDNIQNYWKASVTSIWPAFNVMNGISNVLQSFLDIGVHALNPVVNGVASKMILQDRKAFALEQKMFTSGLMGQSAKEELARVLTAPMFTDNTGTIWSYGELRTVMQQKNIAFNRGANFGQSDIYDDRGVERLFESQDSLLKKSMRNGNPFSSENILFKTSRHFSQALEEQARTVNFITNLRATGDPYLSAQRTKMFLFDYGHLSQFEKTVMKRIMPFYTFTRKNLELQSRTLMTNPGRIEAELTGIQNISDVISGGQLTPEEEKAMPSWMKNGINILQKQHGSQFTIISGLKTPIEQPFQQFQPNALLGSISPLIRVPFEQLSGYSLYNGKLLSDVTNAATFKDAPKFLKDAIGFTEVHGKFKDGTTFTRYESLRPEIMNVILNLPPTSRVFGSLRQFETSNNDNSQKLLTFLTGIKPQTLDEQVEQAKRDKELVTKLDRLLTLSGVIGQFTKTFIPKE